MTLWKDINNNIHDDMDGEASKLPSWPAGLTEITSAEADVIRNPPKTQAQLNAEIQAQIEAIERKELLCRSVREQLLENTERANPSKSQAEIYASNVRYKNIKDVDDQIAALRAQII